MMPCNHNIEVERFLANQEAEENMAEELETRIEERAKDLMQEGESCHPYGITIYANVPHTYYNLFEALGDIPEPQQKVISEQWREAAPRSDTDPVFYNNVKAALFDQLDKLVRDYWLRQARHMAEKEL